MDVPIWIWIAFNVLVLAMLALDLGVFHRTAHAVSLREAGIWSAVWVAIAAAVGVAIHAAWGAESALQFATGYLIEKALSVDNVFVFVMLFAYFAVPARHQHRVLVWGVLGALVMRGVFIGAGAYVIARFHWVMYVFGAILILTGIRMARSGGAHDPGHNPVLRLARRFLPLTSDYDGQRMWVRRDGRWLATPLFLVLLLIEATDLVFAIDSIPAIFAVTRDPFLVYTANVLAMLGLRSMYFLLAGVVHRFVYLKHGLSAVLVFVGAKMTLADLVKVPVGVSLAVVATLIGGAIVLSLRRAASDAARDAAVAERRRAEVA